MFVIWNLLFKLHIFLAFNYKRYSNIGKYRYSLSLTLKSSELIIPTRGQDIGW